MESLLPAESWLPASGPTCVLAVLATSFNLSLVLGFSQPSGLGSGSSLCRERFPPHRVWPSMKSTVSLLVVNQETETVNSQFLDSRKEQVQTYKPQAWLHTGTQTLPECSHLMECFPEGESLPCQAIFSAPAMHCGMHILSSSHFLSLSPLQRMSIPEKFSSPRD